MAGKQPGSKKCENCKFSEQFDGELRCFYPPIVQTWPEGIKCEGPNGARWYGRHCGPGGEHFIQKR